MARQLVKQKDSNMKLNGLAINAPSVEYVVIPRQSGDVIIECGAVLDYEDFTNLNPQPTPPELLLPGGERKKDVEDKEYLKRIGDWARQKTAWLFIKSISNTPGLEWESVELSNPETWEGWQDELGSGFSDAEINRIMDGVLTANGMNQTKIDEALKSFLATREAAQKA